MGAFTGYEQYEDSKNPNVLPASHNYSNGDGAVASLFSDEQNNDNDFFQDVLERDEAAIEEPEDEITSFSYAASRERFLKRKKEAKLIEAKEAQAEEDDETIALKHIAQLAQSSNSKNPLQALNKIKVFVLSRINLKTKEGSKQRREKPLPEYHAVLSDAAYNINRAEYPIIHGAVEDLLNNPHWDFSPEALTQAIENRSTGDTAEVSSTQVAEGVRDVMARWRALKGFEYELDYALNETPRDQLNMNALIVDFERKIGTRISEEERERLLAHAENYIRPIPEVMDNANAVYQKINMWPRPIDEARLARAVEAYVNPDDRNYRGVVNEVRRMLNYDAPAFDVARQIDDRVFTEIQEGNLNPEEVQQRVAELVNELSQQNNLSETQSRLLRQRLQNTAQNYEPLLQKKLTQERNLNREQEGVNQAIAEITNRVNRGLVEGAIDPFGDPVQFINEATQAYFAQMEQDHRYPGISPLNQAEIIEMVTNNMLPRFEVAAESRRIEQDLTPNLNNPYLTDQEVEAMVRENVKALGPIPNQGAVIRQATERIQRRLAVRRLQIQKGQMAADDTLNEYNRKRVSSLSASDSTPPPPPPSNNKPGSPDRFNNPVKVKDNLHQQIKEAMDQIAAETLDSHTEVEKFYADDAKMYVDSYLQKYGLKEYNGFIELPTGQHISRVDLEKTILKQDRNRRYEKRKAQNGNRNSNTGSFWNHVKSRMSTS